MSKKMTELRLTLKTSGHKKGQMHRLLIDKMQQKIRGFYPQPAEFAILFCQYKQVCNAFRSSNKLLNKFVLNL